MKQKWKERQGDKTRFHGDGSKKLESSKIGDISKKLESSKIGDNSKKQESCKIKSKYVKRSSLFWNSCYENVLIQKPGDVVEEVQDPISFHCDPRRCDQDPRQENPT